jgi:DNA invertase Pin-like site-specific DNA recombinase
VKLVAGTALGPFCAAGTPPKRETNQRARTNAALAAAKAKGVQLGGPKLKQAQRRGIASNKANADRFAANVLPVIEQIKASGAKSLRAIAKALNARGIATARGGVWTPVQVTAVLRRASSLA